MATWLLKGFGDDFFFFSMLLDFIKTHFEMTWFDAIRFDLLRHIPPPSRAGRISCVNELESICPFLLLRRDLFHTRSTPNRQLLGICAYILLQKKGGKWERNTRHVEKPTILASINAICPAATPSGH